MINNKILPHYAQLQPIVDNFRATRQKTNRRWRNFVERYQTRRDVFCTGLNANGIDV